MNKILFFIFFIFLIGCTQQASSENIECANGIFDSYGECCEQVYEEDCEFGYVEGSCNSECMEDSNVDSVFEENPDIEPPGI